MTLASEIAPHLPYLRRYARALTGSQGHGDAFVRAALEAIVQSPADFPRDVDARLGLYKTFHAIWSTANVDLAPEPTDAASFEKIAQDRLAAITPLSRQALLLTAMEGFTNDDAGYVIDASASDVASLVAEALAEIDRQTATRVLIIEDEPIIAMDLEFDRPRPRPRGHRRRRHPRRSGRARQGEQAGAGPRRHPARRCEQRHRRGQGHPRRVQRARDLHHRLPRAAADG